MRQTNHARQFDRSDAELAQMVTRVVQAVQPDAIVCVTKSGEFVHHLIGLAIPTRIIAASAEADTYEQLHQKGIETVRLPLHAAEKYSQVRHVFSVLYRTGVVKSGEFVICAVGAGVYPEEGDLIVLTDVDPTLEHLPVTDLLKLTDGIQPIVLETCVVIASKIGRAARRGKRIGAIFMLGDSNNVLKGARQLIPNPFHGHDDAVRRLTNPEIHHSLIELAKLDGAFIVRGDGFIQTAAVFLATEAAELDLAAGLGTRHAAAAGVTARTNATAIVVSATDGNVRIFSGGNLVMQLDPEVPYGPIAM